MSPRRLLLSGVALLALGSVANAAEVPAPCGPDPRERCINYRPGQIVRVYLAPGATVTVELPASESVFFVGASDDEVTIAADGALVAIPYAEIQRSHLIEE